ncbi:MAG: TM2 domain-containing protein, partial [Verrucomicrobiota bacterium]
ILPAIILCLFLGVFGAHAFYAGRIKQGIAIIGCLLSPVIISLLDSLLSFGGGRTPPASSDTVAPPSVVSPSVVWNLMILLFFCMWLLVIVHVICDLVRILVGAYKDGRGQKITKWT